MLVEDSSVNCRCCCNPLAWIGLTKRLQQSSVVYELNFRCDTCKREYQFRDGKLKELQAERDLVAEQLAMLKAEIDAFRSRRCPKCGGPLDDWLVCDWCRERYSVESGELVPRAEVAVPLKPMMRGFYAVQPK